MGLAAPARCARLHPDQRGQGMTQATGGLAAQALAAARANPQARYLGGPNEPPRPAGLASRHI